MKTAFVVTSLVALAATAFAQDPTPPARPQSPAPVAADAARGAPKTLQLGQRLLGTTTLKDIDGKDYAAQKNFMGKIVVVNFYSIDCPIQKGWDSRLAAIQKQYGEKGVIFLNIDSNVKEIDDGTPTGDAKPYDKIRKHLKEKNLPYTVLVDSGNVVADLFGARTTPDIFVFNTKGQLVYRGLIDDDQKGTKGDKATQHLKPVLDKLVAKEEVKPFETKPEGCDIKRAPKAKDAAPSGGK